jgi:hypothetical protein
LQYKDVPRYLWPVEVFKEQTEIDKGRVAIIRREQEVDAIVKEREEIKTAMEVLQGHQKEFNELLLQVLCNFEILFIQ